MSRDFTTGKKCCSHCRAELTIANVFHYRDDSPDKAQYYCKPCMKDYQRIRYIERRLVELRKEYRRA